MRTIILGLFLVVLPTVRAASVFNFDNDNVGTSTAFTDMNNGVSATFTSNGDPGGFVVVPTFFSTLTGNVLVDPGPSGTEGLTLTVSFNTELSNINLAFGINLITSSDTFTLAAYNGSKKVGSSSSAGSIPSGFSYPEGTAKFSGAIFNKVVLSSTGLDFAIDNVSVGAATPEPGSLPVVGLITAVAGVVGYRRKRRVSKV